MLLDFYLFKREQYGSWPIVYGQHFNAKLDSRKPYLDGDPVYAKDEKKGKYMYNRSREKIHFQITAKKIKCFFQEFGVIPRLGTLAVM